MKLLCVISGHKWHVDESETDTEIVLCCNRCGQKQLAPVGSAYGNRVDAKAKRDSVLGPGTRR